ncbi:MAG: prefoldin subunit alpha [Candidatus Pacearchaeota archaeon]
MESQEYLLKLQLLEQQANQFGEQLKIIDQQIDALLNLKEDMSKLENSKEKEIYAEIGKGIYIKAQIENNKKELLVDVGNKIFVPKTFEDIKNIINNQIGKFKNVKDEIAKRVTQINEELDKIVNQANKYSKTIRNKKSSKKNK